MRTPSDVTKVIVEILEEEEHSRSYSGRGMMGRSCLGITTAAPLTLIYKLARELTLEDIDITQYSRICQDSMGLDFIVYFPDLPPPIESEQDDC